MWLLVIHGIKSTKIQILKLLILTNISLNYCIGTFLTSLEYERTRDFVPSAVTPDHFKYISISMSLRKKLVFLSIIFCIFLQYRTELSKIWFFFVFHVSWLKQKGRASRGYGGLEKKSICAMYLSRSWNLNTLRCPRKIGEGRGVKRNGTRGLFERMRFRYFWGLDFVEIERKNN